MKALDRPSTLSLSISTVDVAQAADSARVPLSPWGVALWAALGLVFLVIGAYAASTDYPAPPHRPHHHELEIRPDPDFHPLPRPTPAPVAPTPADAEMIASAR